MPQVPVKREERVPVIHHDFDSAARPGAPNRLRQRPCRIGRMVNHAPRVNQVKEAVLERQHFGICHANVFSAEAVELEPTIHISTAAGVRSTPYAFAPALTHCRKSVPAPTPTSRTLLSL